MYSIHGLDRVIELDGVPQSSVGAQLPIVLSDEHKILLAYIVQDTLSDWDSSYVRVIDPSTSGEPLALVEFASYWFFMFGAPNDEAFHGHPLANRGLHPYGAFRFDNSSWVRQLERMNSAHPYHKPKRFQKFNHFIFAFHDSNLRVCSGEFYGF